MPKILVITGGVIHPKDKSVSRLLKKQLLQLKMSEHHWLELKIKANIGEALLLGEQEKKRYLKNSVRPKLRHFLESKINEDPPELTEVAIQTLLHREGLDCDTATFDDLFSQSEDFRRKLDSAEVIFASSTFLRDLSELIPLMEMLKRPHNRVVVGGALMGTLGSEWEGHPSIDLIAVGYGEFLIPPIARWIKSEFQTLLPPPRGRLERRKNGPFLFSGSPETLSLDFIEKPDWGLSMEKHGARFEMISYESVRGCPYRCAFCNYPYLFDDTKFRTKSAQKMADDWEDYYKRLGVQYITCLDSLFTMPKPRLIEFCQELIKREVRVKWICYARADDLADEKVVELLVRSGCIQVQIGIESGDQQILQNMNKRVSPEVNRLALENCRKHQLTSVISLIAGFPGETRETIDRTIDFLETAPADFFFIATFSTRVPGVPILRDEQRKKFGLMTMDNLFSVSPYWAHDTMDCREASQMARYMGREIVRRRIAMDATLFYRSILFYEPELRDELLDLQLRASQNHWWLRAIFGVIHRGIDWMFRRDFNRSMRSEKLTSV